MKTKIADALNFYFPENARLSGWIRSVQQMTEVYYCKKVKVNGFIFEDGEAFIMNDLTHAGQFLSLEPLAEAEETAWYPRLNDLFTYTMDGLIFVWMTVTYLEVTDDSHPITHSKYYIMQRKPLELLLSPKVIKAAAHFLHKKCFYSIDSSSNSCRYEPIQGFRKEQNNYRQRNSIVHVTDPPDGDL